MAGHEGAAEGVRWPDVRLAAQILVTDRLSPGAKESACARLTSAEGERLIQGSLRGDGVQAPEGTGFDLLYWTLGLQGAIEFSPCTLLEAVAVAARAL